MVQISLKMVQMKVHDQVQLQDAADAGKFAAFLTES